MTPVERPKLTLMPFRPQSLAYQLRALFDAGVATPSDIATSCGVERSRVDGWLRGKVPDRVTEIQVRKVISFHARRARRDFLKLETDDPTGIAAPPPVRGIQEVDREFPGIRTFHVITSKGEKRLQIIAAASDVNEVLMEFMEEWLNDLDPQISLLQDQPIS